MKKLKILFILFIFLVYGFSAIAQSSYPVQWGEIQGLAKISTNIIEPGQNGWLKFSVDFNSLSNQEAANYQLMVGLHEQNDPSTYQSLNYGLYINGTNLYIVHQGQIEAYLGKVGNQQQNIVSIVRQGSTILFLKDDVQLGILETNGSQGLYILGVSLQNIDVLPPITTSAPPTGGGTSSPAENRNWVHTRVYDGNGINNQHLISDSRTYFDELGRVTQQQAKSFTNDEVLAVQPMYDVYGRAVGQTLSAPVGSNQIGYKNNFLTNSSGNTYSFADFDKPDNFSGGNIGTADNPKAVGKQANTVGWYYSNQNTKEAYVATTDYPYGWSKSTPDGSAVRSSSVGDHHRMGAGEERRAYSFSPSTELEYLYGYARSYEIDRNSTALDPISKHLSRQLKAYKTISIGEDGVEYISFSSASGLRLATAVSGAPTIDNHCIEQKASYTLYGKGDRSANVHIPAANKGSVTLDLGDTDFNGKFSLKITDLNTYELLIAGTDYNLLGSGQIQQITFLGNHATTTGFYKVSFDMNPLEEEPNKFILTTETDYSNWTLLYYNQWGQLMKSVSPQGIDCSYDASTYHNPVQTTTPIGYLLDGVSNPYYIVDWTPNPSTNMRTWTLPTIQDPTIDHRKLSVTIDVDGDRIYQGSSQPPSYQWATSTSVNGNNMVIGYKLTMGFFAKNSAGMEMPLQQEIIVADIALENNGGTMEAFVINPYQLNYEWDDNVLDGFNEVLVRILDIKVGFSSGNYNQPYDPTDNVHKGYINVIHFPYFYESEIYQANEIPHDMATVYHYDDEGQLVAEKSDDEGLTEYIYDDEGKLRFAQDAKQQANNRYAYIIYDRRGRIVETGEADGSMNSAYNNRNDDDGTTLSVSIRHNRTYVLYDDTDGTTLPSGYQQNYLGGRISKTWNDRNATYYSYNHQGELTFTAQDIEDLGWKTMDYTYDYFGRLIKKTYQKGEDEEFEYLYTYDRDGRMVRLETDNGNIIQHAEYEFYLHGPLKRTELGDQLQGIDYVYTITGALKSINHPNIGRTNTDNNNKGFDPGQDGFAGTNSGFAKDAFGMTIDYYGGDYQRSGTFINTGASAVSSNATLPQEHRDGRIKGIRWNTQGANQLSGLRQNMWSYDYDWKQQLTSATFGSYEKNNTVNSNVAEVFYPDNGTGLVPGKFTATNDYKVHGITYQADRECLQYIT